MATEASVMPRGGNFNGREKSDTAGLEVYKSCNIANQMQIVKLGEVYGLRLSARALRHEVEGLPHSIFWRAPFW